MIMKTRQIAICLAAVLAFPALAQTASKPLNLNLPPQELPVPGSTTSHAADPPGTYYGDLGNVFDGRNSKPKPRISGSVGYSMGFGGGGHGRGYRDGYRGGTSTETYLDLNIDMRQPASSGY
jgi:hypothetical protein